MVAQQAQANCQKIDKGLNSRIFADFDNERGVDSDIVGLAQTDEIKNYMGETIFLKEGDYVYLYLPVDEILPEYVFSEGFVIPNPYEFKPYKWCCKLTRELEYIEDYESSRYSNDEKNAGS